MFPSKRYCSAVVDQVIVVQLQCGIKTILYGKLRKYCTNYFENYTDDPIVKESYNFLTLKTALLSVYYSKGLSYSCRQRETKP